MIVQPVHGIFVMGDFLIMQ